MESPTTPETASKTGRGRRTRRVRVTTSASAATATSGPTMPSPRPKPDRRAASYARAHSSSSRLASTPVATARSHVCTSTSVVSAPSIVRGVLWPPPGRSVARSSTPSPASVANIASAVATQRSAGPSRGRFARTPSGRSNKNSWKPMTCSTNARASHSEHGVGAVQLSASTARAARANPSHARWCRQISSSTI